MMEFSPVNYMILPTSACQAACTYCFGVHDGMAMSKEVLLAAIDFIERTAPGDQVIHITFHGGEPLLAGYDWYAFALPRLRERFGLRLRLSMQSNLWAMDEKTAALFGAYHVSMGTSADGPQELCDAQRGDGYFARNHHGQDILRNYGMAVSEICTFTHQTAGQAAEVFSYYSQTGRPYAIHGAVNTLSEAPGKDAVTAEDMEEVFLATLAAYGRQPGKTRVTTLDNMARGCFEEKGCICTFFQCLGVFAAIAPDGGVYSCQRFCGHDGYRLGFVQEGLDGEQVLRSEGYRLLAEKEERAGRVCASCTHFSYCSGGCLYNICTSHTDKDPYCSAYRRVFDRLSRDMALEMGGLMTGRLRPEDAALLQMAGNLPHPYDAFQDGQRLRQAVRLGEREYDGDETLRRYKENRIQNRGKVYLHVTFDCPLRCGHCYADGGEQTMRPIPDRLKPGQAGTNSAMPEMPPELVLETVRQAQREMFASVVITGGEPLVHTRIDRILEGLRHFDRKAMGLVLRTSLGFPVSENLLLSVCRTFTEIVVSVDGDEESHDDRRGQGRYGRTVENLRWIKELGYISRVGICATLDQRQREGKAGRSVEKLCGELSIAKLRFRPILPLGRGVGTPYEGVSCIDENALHSFSLRFHCGLGQNLYIEPDGGAYPCYAWCGREQLLGNAADGLGAILKSPAFRRLSRHDVDTNKKCRSCTVRYLCGGFCKAWAGDKSDLDSGEFDCTAKKNALLRLASIKYPI